MVLWTLCHFFLDHPVHGKWYSVCQGFTVSSYVAFVVRCLTWSFSLLLLCTAGADKVWIRKCYTGWYTVVPARSPPDGYECCGLTCVPVQSIRPHHSASSASSLALCARVNNIQTGRTSLPVSLWICAGLSGWRFTACHQTTWTTTPALVIDFSTGCTTDTALHERSVLLQQRFGTICCQKWRLQTACEHLKLN